MRVRTSVRSGPSCPPRCPIRWHAAHVACWKSFSPVFEGPIAKRSIEHWQQIVVLPLANNRLGRFRQLQERGVDFNVGAVFRYIYASSPENAVNHHSSEIITLVIVVKCPSVVPKLRPPSVRFITHATV